MNKRQQIPWRAMAILVGKPDFTEAELYSLFGDGRCSFGVELTDGSMGVDVVVLCMEKETFPTVCYVSWNGLGS